MKSRKHPIYADIFMHIYLYLGVSSLTWNAYITILAIIMSNKHFPSIIVKIFNRVLYVIH